jgi:4-hydroxy-3-methylbut-2-enyl diphosphate reductase
MRTFQIPKYYKSNIITGLKKKRIEEDPRKKDYSPSVLDYGNIQFLIPRHFGFCYGVENAIEISYKAIEENPGKRIFLLSEMIHNPEVNNDLIGRGVRFINDTAGNQLITLDELTPEDVVIIPAFGTTIETLKILEEKKLTALKYDTTCPFVEKVWNRAGTLGKTGFSIIIHGKYRHEETRATFSHSKQDAPTVIVRDLEEAKLIGETILGNISKEKFFELFKNKHSAGFDPERDLYKIGVVNQTTMLASETQNIADYLKSVMIKKYGESNIKEHIADTRDTLCYATHDNQKATLALLEEEADIALVVGGYNSSNTSHIVELCETRFKTFFISSEKNLISGKEIRHYDYNNHLEISTNDFLPQKKPVRIILTSGASCPDSVVEAVLNRILFLYEISV